MALYDIHFTLIEARATIPDLRRRLIRINDLIADIRATQTREGLAQTAIFRGNGKGPLLSGAGAQKEEAQRLIENIAAEGIQIKDLQRGLVDFPHFLHDDPHHEVFLCWQLGEDTIEYWHEIDDGFAGRERI
jgi:hypothetical protein